MIVKQAILTVLLASSHCNAKDGVKFRDAKPKGFARKLRGGGMNSQTVGFGGVGLGLERDSGSKNEKGEEKSSSASSLVHDDPESSGLVYDDYGSESVFKAMDEAFQFHELLVDSNDSTLATGGVANGSDAVGGKKEEQDATAMFGGNNKKKKSASAASSLFAEELVGAEFVKEMLGDAGSNKSMSVGHGDNKSSTAATRNGGSALTSRSTDIKTSSSSDNGRSKGLTGGGKEEDMKRGTGNEGTYYGVVGGLQGVRVSNSKDTSSKEGKGTADASDATVIKSTQDVIDDTARALVAEEKEQESRNLEESSSSSSCYQVTFETDMDYILRTDIDLDCPYVREGPDYRVPEDQCLAVGIEIAAQQGLDLVDNTLSIFIDTDYSFHKHKDSPGYNIENFQGTIEEMITRCESLENCLGFNTNGWMKSFILDQDNWHTWTDDDEKGFYLKPTAPCGCFLKNVDTGSDSSSSTPQFQITYNRGRTCSSASSTAGLLCKRPNSIVKDGKNLLSWNSHNSCKGGCHLETKADTDGTYLEITQEPVWSGSFWILDNIQFDEGEDFSMIAKLKVNGVDGTSTKAGFYINDKDWFAFDLSNEIGTTSDSAFNDVTLPENFFRREDFGTHSDKLFTFQIERVDGRISFYITVGSDEEKELVASNEYNQAINKFQWRPYHGILKIYEWSLFPTYSSRDFIVEGYLNENSNSVIPSSCHDKTGANCTLEICDVEKIVITASEETTLVPKNYWKMKAYGTGVYDLDTFHLISNASPLDICLDDTSWYVSGSSKYRGMRCQDFSNDAWCDTIMKLDDSAQMGKSIEEACCVCGGSKSFTTYPSLAPTNAPTVSQMPTAPTAQPTACVDDGSWYLDEDTGLGCESITEDMCNLFGDYVYNEKSLKDACCVCGGGKHENVKLKSCHQITLNTASNIINKGYFKGLGHSSGSDDDGEYWFVTGSDPASDNDNWNITLPIDMGEDFVTIAKLKIERLSSKSSAVGFYLDDDYFGFDGAGGPIFTHNNGFDIVDNPKRFLDDVFTFKVERSRGHHIKFFINDKFVGDKRGYNKAINTLTWRPWRGNLKIYDWTFIPSSDFTLDGYMNSVGTNVIPTSCYDTLDDYCSLDICGVEKVVIQSTGGSSRAFFSNRALNQINTHTDIRPGEKHYIGGSSTVPFALHPSDFQPFMELEKNGNLVARAWNGKEYVKIYESGRTFDCDENALMALFDGNTGLVVGCNDGTVDWGEDIIAEQLEEKACAIAYLNGAVVCLSNTGEVKRTYGGDGNTLGIQYNHEEGLVDEVTSSFEEFCSSPDNCRDASYQCHDIELRRLEEPMEISSMEYNVRAHLGSKGDIPTGSFVIPYRSRFDLTNDSDLQSLGFGNGDKIPFLTYQSDNNILAFLYGPGRACGSLYNAYTQRKCSGDRSLTFTKDGRIHLNCTAADNNNQNFNYTFPDPKVTSQNGLNEKNELCKLKYFDGQVVCIFPDGNIAYTLPGHSKHQKCARAWSFEIPGYTNPMNYRGNSIPRHCVEEGSSCHLRVCGVDSLKIPASVDVSRYTFLDESGKMNFFENSKEMRYYEFPFGNCKDVDGWFVGGTSMYSGMTCNHFTDEAWCDTIMALDDSTYMGKSIKEACCVCGGSKSFTTYPSLAPTNAPTISQMPTAPTARPTACVDDGSWYLNEDTRLGCESITEEMCNLFGDYVYNEKSLKEACCICNGGAHVSMIPSLVPTNQPSEEPTPCVDDTNWSVGGSSMYKGMKCQDFSNDAWCDTIMALDDSAQMGKSIEEACCVCGGSALFTPHPSVAPTNTPTISKMPTAPTARPTACVDEIDWYLHEDTRLGCESIMEEMCDLFVDYVYNEKSLKDACCVCGGGIHFTVMPSSSVVPTMSPKCFEFQIQSLNDSFEISDSLRQVRGNVGGGVGDADSVFNFALNHVYYLDDAGGSDWWHQSNVTRPHISFHGDGQITAWAFCSTAKWRRPIFSTNTPKRCDGSKGPVKMTFTEDRLIEIKCTESSTSPFHKTAGTSTPPRDDGEKCLLKYFDGNVVCMFKDGEIAYTMPPILSNAKCARETSFLIPGFVGANGGNDKYVPTSCLKSGASCEMKVCGVDTLTIPGHVDISKYSFVDEYGIMSFSSVTSSGSNDKYELISGEYCNNFKMLTLTNSIEMSDSLRQVRGNVGGGVGDADSVFNFTPNRVYYLDDAGGSDWWHQSNVTRPHISFHGDGQITAWAFCSTAKWRRPIFSTNTPKRCDGSKGPVKMTFTEDRLIEIKCTESSTSPFHKTAGTSTPPRDDGEKCLLKYFDGNVVCMFKDGEIAYTMPPILSNAKCARETSFLIPGFVGANGGNDKYVPTSCLKSGASCEMKVCGVDTLTIPGHVDISKYSFVDEYGVMSFSSETTSGSDDKYELIFESCTDLQSWSVGGSSMYKGMKCQDFSNDAWCDTIMALDDSSNMGKSIKEACCVCGGSKSFTTYPSVAPTNTPTISQMPTAPTARPTACVDDSNWYLQEDTGLGCESITEDMCNLFVDYVYNEKSLKDACCVCNGGAHVSMIPSLVPTSQPSEEPTHCVDDTNWSVGGSSVYSGMMCDDFANEVWSQTIKDTWCDTIMALDDSINMGKSIKDACCACGGSALFTTHPSVAPTNAPTVSQMPTTPTAQPTTCVDDSNWYLDKETQRLGCASITEDMCEHFDEYIYNRKSVKEACCVCNGGKHISVFPSFVPTDQPSVLPTLSPTSRPSDQPSTVFSKNLEQANLELGSCYQVTIETITGSDAKLKVDGYMNINGTNILPTFCHDTDGATCRIEVCGVNFHDIAVRDATSSSNRRLDSSVGATLFELDVESSEEKNEFQFDIVQDAQFAGSNGKRSLSTYSEYQITTHTWIKVGEKYNIGGLAAIPVEKQPYMEIQNNGNIVAKAWNGNEFIIIYNSEIQVTCDDDVDPIALFQGNAALVVGCNKDTHINGWQKAIISGSLGKDGLCAITYLSGYVVCLSNTGAILQRYGNPDGEVDQSRAKGTIFPERIAAVQKATQTELPSHQCHDIELKRHENNPMKMTETEYSIRANLNVENNDDSRDFVPFGSFEFKINKSYYLDGDDDVKTYIIFQGDKNIVTYTSGCGPTTSLQTNRRIDAEASFTTEGTILVKFDNEEKDQYIFPEDGNNGLNTKNELCRLRYFDGKVVCMFSDGKIAYTLPAANMINENNQKCARGKSFKIPGYTNPDTSLGNSIPQSCVEEESSCHLRVCGVDTLKIPANIDVSKFEITNMLGLNSTRSFNSTDGFYNFKFCSDCTRLDIQSISIKVLSDPVIADPVHDIGVSSLLDDTGFFISNNDSIELHGNAWKVFKLPDESKVTSTMQLELDIDIEDKANGHLICFADEISEDLDFDYTNCLSLINTDAAMWSNAKKAYNLALRKTSTINPISFSWLGASNAVDGLSTTFTLIKKENEEEASLNGEIMVDLETSQSISRIEVSSIFGLPQSLNVDFSNTENEWGNNEGTLTNGKINFANPLQAQYIKITPTSAEKDLLISNIEVIGSNDLSSITYPLSVLFEGRETSFQYIALVQDSSSDSNEGRSTISNIRFTETSSNGVSGQTQAYTNDLEGTYFRLSHTSSNKVSIGGIKSGSNSCLAFLTDSATFDMSQVFLLECDGHIKSLQFPEYYLHIDDNCNIEFIKMENMESISSKWLLDPNASNNIFIQCQGELRALTVVDDVLTLGPKPSQDEQHWALERLTSKQISFISSLEESSTCYQIKLNSVSNIIKEGQFNLIGPISHNDDDGRYWSVNGRKPGESTSDNYVVDNIPIDQGIKGENFSMIAKLRVEGSASGAAFYINTDDYLGFDGVGDRTNKIFVNDDSAFYHDLDGTVNFFNTEDFGTHSDQLFTFRVERENGRIKFYINDNEEPVASNEYNSTIKKFTWRPWRANLKIYEWTFIPSKRLGLDVEGHKFWKVNGSDPADDDNDWEIPLPIATSEDFVTIAKLKIERISNKGSAVGFFLDNDYFGFDGHNSGDHIYTGDFDIVQIESTSYLNDVFTFKVERTGNHIKFFINDKFVGEKRGYSKAINTLKWRPRRANLKIYEWTFISDYTLDGYMNEQGTNVIPKSCYDTLDDYCSLDICGVEKKMVVQSTVHSTPRVFLSSDFREDSSLQCHDIELKRLEESMSMTETEYSIRANFKKKKEKMPL
ncbi:hypothetical protein CTEN210_00959 [Chaetoceros tenuissimus]|uniref:Staphylococcus aureus surface protein A n=1 Tax=Chaetoceros tenuissimus TaxID=426638 RepID=A0AAD3CG41_9STRA|nr:hypothetical protein CTEN210_00959 [Chaetoceros tenuissimus]